MSTARFPCERCGGSGLSASGLVCTLCSGSGFTVPVESPGDAINDFTTRHLGALVLAFAAAIALWLGPLRRWAFGDDKK